MLVTYHEILKIVVPCAQLRCLELRGHERLRSLPDYLAALPALRRLDVSYNRSLDPGVVSKLTALQSLSMQVGPWKLRF